MQESKVTGKRKRTSEEDQQQEQGKKRAKVDQQQPPIPAKHIGMDRFEFDTKTSQIGSGDFGVVFVGIDKETGKRVAIKREDIKSSPKPSFNDLEPLALAELKQACDPYLLCFRDLVQIGGSSDKDAVRYLITEFLEGYQTLLDTKNLTMQDRSRIACGILAGVRQLHSAGYVHGDLSERNVMVRLDSTTRNAGSATGAGAGAGAGSGTESKVSSSRWSTKLIDFGQLSRVEPLRGVIMLEHDVQDVALRILRPLYYMRNRPRDATPKSIAQFVQAVIDASNEDGRLRANGKIEQAKVVQLQNLNTWWTRLAAIETELSCPKVPKTSYGGDEREHPANIAKWTDNRDLLDKAIELAKQEQAHAHAVMQAQAAAFESDLAEWVATPTPSGGGTLFGS
jgi:hypothetical protein